MRFRVATYNIHKCRGMDWRVRPDRIAAVLREVNADIVALQEVLADQAPCFARKLDFPFVLERRANCAVSITGTLFSAASR